MILSNDLENDAIFDDEQLEYLPSEDVLAHYGMPRRSGRYPWGSGENPYQHASTFMQMVKEKRSQGMSDTEIAREMDMSTGEFRSKVTISKEEILSANQKRARELKEKGYSNVKIGEIMGYPESTIRNFINPNSYKKKNAASDVAIILKDQVDTKGIIDVGTGVELDLGVSATVLDAALKKLQDDGYNVYSDIRIEQMTNPGKKTIFRVAAPSDVSKADVYKHIGDIQTIENYDQGLKIAEEKHPGFKRTKYGLYYPESISSDRVKVRYADEGGIEKDGVIELRRGVEDISLGKANYAQVRIAVDGTHYLKGMAIYSDGKDMPDGVDIIFNSNKYSDSVSNKKEVFKKLKSDPDNPFGAAIKSEDNGGQRFYTDKNGKERLSVINIVNAEGDWGNWSKTLSAQFLSKQNIPLIKKQLGESYASKLDEYNDILSLTNPTIKAKLLESFASDCDASASHLKAVALPRQASHVILPITDMKPDEVYAPKYKNGETVVLIRYPHAGTFEIPRLKVNNKQPTAKAILGNTTDAIGISSEAAEQLSGADFDGDTVMLIPVSNGGIGTKVNSSKPLEALKGFRTSEYELPKDAPEVSAATGFQKQSEMGKVTNLITDMTILGAKEPEIARAVKHSMVIIDAEKHHLDWRKSYIDNGIAELKTKYQGGPDRGASTLISRAGSEIRVPLRKTLYSDPENPGSVKNGIDVETGKLRYRETGESFHKPKYAYEKDENDKYKKDEYGKKIPIYESYINSEGKEVKKRVVDHYSEKETLRTTTITKMDSVEDAFDLVSPTNSQVEQAYAIYANQLKALGNEARKQLISTKPIEYSKEAKELYSKEVESLNSKLLLAQKNAPRERQAQAAATAIFNIKKYDNPDMSDDDKKKIKAQTLAEQRVRYGAKKNYVEIDDREWEAIQAGAIHTQKLKDILNNTDMDKLKERAMPRDREININDFKKSRINNMDRNGHTISEIAEAVGLSASTVAKVLNGTLK